MFKKSPKNSSKKSAQKVTLKNQKLSKDCPNNHVKFQALINSRIELLLSHDEKCLSTHYFWTHKRFFLITDTLVKSINQWFRHLKSRSRLTHTISKWNSQFADHSGIYIQYIGIYVEWKYERSSRNHVKFSPGDCTY